MVCCRHIVLLVVLLLAGNLLLAGTSAAQLDLSHAELVYTGNETLSLHNRPNGDGYPFTEAFLPAGGGFANGTIVLTLISSFDGMPIVGYPASDMWIVSEDGGMVACGGSAVADGPTNGAGQTVWAEPLFAGGHSETACRVAISGDYLPGPGLNLIFNSPDITGDGLVNLQDAGHFVSYLAGTYGHAGDFNYDGVINISDAGLMAVALGAACP